MNRIIYEFNKGRKMRRIKHAVQMNGKTFTPIEIYKVKLEDGEQVDVFDRDFKEEKFLYKEKQFTREELQRINSIN
jgi:hypothetical protein